MNTFTINGKKITAKAIDFNTICDLEDYGLNFADIQKKSTSFMRAYLAISAGIDTEEAGLEMQNHIIGGGNFEDLIKAMTKEIENSDFFRNLNKTEKKNS